MPSPPTLGLEIISGCRSSYDQSYYHCNDAYDGITDNNSNGWAYNGNLPAWVIFELAQKKTVIALTLMNGQHRIDQTHRLIKFKVTLKQGKQWITPDVVVIEDPKASIDNDGIITLNSGHQILHLNFEPISNIDEIRIDVMDTDHIHGNLVLNEIIPHIEIGM